MSGNYTIDATKAASSTNYKTFTSAVTDLDSGKRYDGGTANGPGVSGSVIFNVSNGVYNEAITIASASGASSKNTITFQSKNGDSSQVVLENANNVITIGNAVYFTFKGITIQGTGTYTTAGNYMVYANNSGSDHMNIYSNSQMTSKQTQEICKINQAGLNLLKVAMEKLSLSARAYDRILKVARTVADLANSDDIKIEHLAEAITYRSLDRENWAG